jgi:zinc/manganese transport system substrate-binding protein
MIRFLFPLSAMLAFACLGAAQASAEPIAVVAAENFYGDIAAQLGGPNVTVTSILSNPDQDPHLFEASASTARAISAARIVVYNGIDYDPWIEKLLAAAKSNDRLSIVVADLAGKKPGDNPHIWYDLAVTEAFAKAFTADLDRLDPAHKADHQQRLAAFVQSLQPLKDKIRRLHTWLAGAKVTATEPVFGYMLDAIGMVSRNMPFQIAVMNNTEPSASDVAGFEADLKTREVRLLVYNSQASDPIADRMKKLADESHVPVIGVTETEPPGETYQGWLAGELGALDQALPDQASAK